MTEIFFNMHHQFQFTPQTKNELGFYHQAPEYLGIYTTIFLNVLVFFIIKLLNGNILLVTSQMKMVIHKTLSCNKKQTLTYIKKDYLITTAIFLTWYLMVGWTWFYSRPRASRLYGMFKNYIAKTTILREGNTAPINA